MFKQSKALSKITNLPLSYENGRRFEQICEELKHMLSDAYGKGVEEAKKHLMSFAGANDDQPTDFDNNSWNKKIVTRVPRGSSRKFVEKSLVSGPKTIGEMRAGAKNSVEQHLSYQTIYLELQRGERDKRYKKEKDKWVLMK